MKKSISILLCCILCTVQAYSQSRDEFIEDYSRQVSRLGYAGVGVEGILDRWESAFPEDGLMMEARYVYWLTKSRSSEVEKMDRAKYLGQKPILSLPDSTGRTVNFFQVNVYDEESFARALGWIDKAIGLYPDECSYSFDKVSGLMEYEGESPDLALELLLEMVDRHSKDRTLWKSDGVVIDGGTFASAIQEYCYKLYLIGSDSSYEGFFILSQKMNRIYPKNLDFINNIGSYYLTAKGNGKKALSYYKKALKLDPEDRTALTNIKVLEMRQARRKNEK